MSGHVKPITVPGRRHAGLANPRKRQDRLGTCHRVRHRRAGRGGQAVRVGVLVAVLRRWIRTGRGLHRRRMRLRMSLRMRVGRRDGLRRRRRAGRHVMRIIHVVAPVAHGRVLVVRVRLTVGGRH